MISIEIVYTLPEESKLPGFTPRETQLPLMISWNAIEA